jgi:hypothetical protein
MAQWVFLPPRNDAAQKADKFSQPSKDLLFVATSEAVVLRDQGCALWCAAEERRESHMILREAHPTQRGSLHDKEL